MRTIATILVFLAMGYSAFGQDPSSISIKNFEERGMQLLSDTQLTDAEIAQLLAFDFSAYRLPNESVIVKVVNGPNIELFSTSRFETGIPDPPVLPAKDPMVSDEDHSGHNHQKAGAGPVRRIQVRLVNVFEIQH